MPSPKERARDRRDSPSRRRYVDGERVRRARQAMAGERELERVTRTFRALGDPTRAKMLLALSIEELCVGDLAGLLRVSPSLVSHQLRVLRDLGLVRQRREGRSSYYRIDDESVRALFQGSLKSARRNGRRRSE